MQNVWKSANIAIVHYRDFKQENVMIDHKGYCKVCDIFSTEKFLPI